jgi:acyl carrier protein
MIDKKGFIENFAAQFDSVNASELTFNTNFRDIEEWSSLRALSIIAMVDESYSVILSGNDMRNSKTIEDIYNIVSSKKQ